MNREPRPSADEMYARATVTSDLGLPIGEGAGAQGILAAAAWTEVQMGSALRRMRIQWENEKPTSSWGAAKQRLAAVPRAERRRVLKNLVKAHVGQYLAAFRRLWEWPEAHAALTMYATQCGIEDADPKAYGVLRRWLENPDREPADPDERLLWAYVRDCLNNAKRALPQGMRGHTNHHPG